MFQQPSTRQVIEEGTHDAIHKLQLVTDIPYAEIENYRTLYAVTDYGYEGTIRIITPQKITQTGVLDINGNGYTAFFGSIVNAENYLVQLRQHALQRALQRAKDEVERIERELSSLS